MKTFTLRLPGDLHAWLCAIADAHSRTTTAEILHLLREERKRAVRREKRATHE